MTGIMERAPLSGLNPHGTGAGSMTPNMPPADQKPSYKSYKKKYNKMRHVFKDKMNTSNMLFDEEQGAVKLARRIQEQNDQLLDLLLEINESRRLVPRLRFDLRSPTPSESAVPALEADKPRHKGATIHNLRAVLEEAKTELATGQITLEAYQELESELQQSINRSKSLSELASVSHTMLDLIPTDDLPPDIREPGICGFITVDHEEEYLAALDGALDGNLVQPESHPIRSSDKEKDPSLRNPVSVYNWLRKHQPQVFLQDSDSAVEKSAQKGAGGVKAAKRASIVAKAEPELADEDGFMTNGVLDGPNKPKRKREDEPYRPKGGNNRPAKKKKMSSGLSERKSITMLDADGG